MQPNSADTLPPVGNGRKCISAEEKLIQVVGFWVIQICLLAKKHLMQIGVLLCSFFILNSWKKRKSKKKKVCKKVLRCPPPTLFEMAIESCDKISADLCVEAVQEGDYDVNYQITNDKLSLFLCACLSGNSRVMICMIERGADVKLCTAYRDSALYLATYGYLHSPQPDLHAISMLIAYGCDINQANLSGFTVLHQAAGKGNLYLTKYFISKGADPNKKNNTGQLPYDIAVAEEHKEVASFLEEKSIPLSKKAPNTI